MYEPQSRTAVKNVEPAAKIPLNGSVQRSGDRKALAGRFQIGCLLVSRRPMLSRLGGRAGRDDPSATDHECIYGAFFSQYLQQTLPHYQERNSHRDHASTMRDSFALARLILAANGMIWRSHCKSRLRTNRAFCGTLSGTNNRISV